MPPAAKPAKAPKPKAAAPKLALTPAQIAAFRSSLHRWYAENARSLPWRGISDPYRTWVSEIMLQQTRVTAVTEHYARFLRLFPSVTKLAAAPEDAILAAWSGLGYYRRARMLHKAACFIAQQLDGQLPNTAAKLRTLPGIGDYTSAAIASIAFGESIAVVDGNVERVLLRITGRPEENTSAARAFLARHAAALVPPAANFPTHNAPGDHNQAIMELGATICLPRAPLCLQCPVAALCRTRGEHITPARTPQRSQRAAFFLSTRRVGTLTQVLLQQRPASASVMPAMYELPSLALEAVATREPILRLRHAITSTNYSVEIYAAETTDDRALATSVSSAAAWHPVNRLHQLPLTGLARKALQRLKILAVGGLNTPAQTRNAKNSTIPA